MTLPASLIIQTSFIGDMALTTPLIAELASRGPVDVVGTPAALPLLQNNPDVRRAIEYDKRGVHSGLSGLVTMAAQLRRCGPYGTAYLAQGSLRSGALAWAARVPRRVGFDTSPGRRFYTTSVPYDEGRHHSARLLALTGDRAQDRNLRPRLYPGEEERELVDRLLAAHDAADDRLLALAPGSVWATKRWPFHADLAARLAGIGRIVVVGGAADASLAAAVQERAAGSIDACGRLSLLGSAELLRRCIVLVSNDSAPVHLASAVNTPTVAIFGPTVPTFGFGPLAARSAVAGHDDLPCRPCHRHGPRRCPLGHWRCMRELAVDEVVRIVERIVR